MKRFREWIIEKVAQWLLIGPVRPIKPPKTFDAISGWDDMDTCFYAGEYEHIWEKPPLSHKKFRF
jgi:hypothetical protein